MTTCCVPTCRNRYEKGNHISFFYFPFKNERRLKAWVTAINRPNWIPKRYHKICSKHFKPHDYSAREIRPRTYKRYLSNNAVPSVFLSNSKIQDKQITSNKQNEDKENVNTNMKMAYESNKNNIEISNTNNEVKKKIYPTQISPGMSHVLLVEDINKSTSSNNNNKLKIKKRKITSSSKKLRRKVSLLQQQIYKKNRMINSLELLIAKLQKQINIMSYQGSPFSTMYDRQDDYDLDEDNEEYLEEDRDVEEQDESDEDTEEASETDMGKSEEHTEIKEQMYQDKLASLKKQLQQLKDGTHPDYNRKIKRLEIDYKERLRLNVIQRDYLTECIERDYILEKKVAVKEYEEKKVDLKENLLTDMEEKRKMIETDRHTMELTGDSMEVKPVMTRKLRRRPNDPVPEKVEKRRKPPPAQLNYLLDEKEIENDLKTISRGKVLTTIRKPVVLPHYNTVNMPSQHIPQPAETSLVETRIEDGKLLYERRWFHRGQPVYVEGKDLSRFAANISAIGTEAIWVKKVSDGSKVRIYTSQLSRGKISIKRRAS